MKTVITKDTILKPYLADMKILKMFQIVGVIITILMIGLFAIGFIGSRKAKWEYLGVAVFILVLFILIPFKASKESRNRIREINRGDFQIIKDVISNKDGDAKKDQGTGDYKWEYTIKVENHGELPQLNKADWDACERGDEIYVIIDSESKPMASFPAKIYSLSNSLLEYVVTD